MRKELGILTLLAVLCVLVAALNPQFLSSANIQNTSRLIGTYGIFSIGVGIVIITGGIDLSVGSMFALLGVLLSLMFWSSFWGPGYYSSRRSGRCASLLNAGGTDGGCHLHHSSRHHIHCHSR